MSKEWRIPRVRLQYDPPLLLFLLVAGAPFLLLVSAIWKTGALILLAVLVLISLLLVSGNPPVYLAILMVFTVVRPIGTSFPILFIDGYTEKVDFAFADRRSS